MAKTQQKAHIDALAKRLTDLHTQRHRIRIGVTDTQISRQNVFQYKTNMTKQVTAKVKGYAPSADKTKFTLNYAYDNDLGLVLFPNHWDLIALDLDTPTYDAWLQEHPWHIAHSRSRGHYGYGSKVAGRGHVWCRLPNSGVYLRTYDKTLNCPSLNAGAPHKVDLLHEHTVFAPPQEWPDLLDKLLTWAELSDDERNAEAPFPYGLFMLQHTAPGDRRDDTLYKLCRDMHDSYAGNRDLDDYWLRLAEATGHTAKKGKAKVEDILRRAKETEDSEETAETFEVPISYDGVAEAIEFLRVELRFNLLTQMAEQHLLLRGREKPVWVALNDIAASSWWMRNAGRYLVEPRTRGTPPPWELGRHWPRVLELLVAVAHESAPQHHPIEAFMNRALKATPMADDKCLLLSLMNPALGADPADIIAVERVILRVLWARLARLGASDPGAHMDGTYCDMMPVLLGPARIGKSRYCRSLGMDHYYSRDAVFSLAPRQFGEVACAHSVLELSEVDGQLATHVRGSAQIRSAAKAYIEQQKFDFRAAYARGGRASSHYVSAIMIGTANGPIPEDAMSDPGMRRRMVHVPLGPAPEKVGGRSEHWGAVWDDAVLSAFARAAKDEAARKDYAARADVHPTAILDYAVRERLNALTKDYEFADDYSFTEAPE